MTVKDLIERIPLVAENYLKAASEQPGLMVEAARFRVAKMRKVAQAEANVGSEESRLALKIRNRRDSDGKKPTEGAVKDGLNASPRVKAARTARDEAHAEEELSKLLLEAFRHRRDMIRVIADSQYTEGLKQSHELDQMSSRSKARELARQADKMRAKDVEVDDDK